MLDDLRRPRAGRDGRTSSTALGRGISLRPPSGRARHRRTRRTIFCAGGGTAGRAPDRVGRSMQHRHRSSHRSGLCRAASRPTCRAPRLAHPFRLRPRRDDSARPRLHRCRRTLRLDGRPARRLRCTDACRRRPLCRSRPRVRAAWHTSLGRATIWPNGVARTTSPSPRGTSGRARGSRIRIAISRRCAGVEADRDRLAAVAAADRARSVGGPPAGTEAISDPRAHALYTRSRPLALFKPSVTLVTVPLGSPGLPSAHAQPHRRIAPARLRRARVRLVARAAADRRRLSRVGAAGRLRLAVGLAASI